MINSVLFFLLVGDLSQFDMFFEFDGSLCEGYWQVVFKVCQLVLVKVIGDISLVGVSYVEKVDMKEVSGDCIEICFLVIKIGEGVMIVDEGVLFD